MKAALGLCQRVMLPQSLFANVYEAGASQICEVPGDLGLRNAQNFLDIANAKLPAARQEVKNPQPRFIRERPKHPVSGSFHICLCVYYSGDQAESQGDFLAQSV